MIYQKEFYFVRHGQTDHALGLCTDQYDIPLNACGRQQAINIQSIIFSLHVKTICYSPLIRAKETKAIIASHFIGHEYEITDLSECSLEIWRDMTSLGCNAYTSSKGSVRSFIEQAKNGINQALSYQGPVLIVAHGGIHWAICCLMNMDRDYDWSIDNCVPVHFTYENSKWKAKRLVLSEE